MYKLSCYICSYGKNVDGNIVLVMKFRKNSKDKYGTTFFKIPGRGSVVVSIKEIYACPKSDWIACFYILAFTKSRNPNNVNTAKYAGPSLKVFNFQPGLPNIMKQKTWI